MGVFLAYIIQSSAYLLLFYLLYKVAFSGETFHRINRIVLLGIYPLTALLPLCDVQLFRAAEEHLAPVSPSGYLWVASTPVPAGDASPWIGILLLAYPAGVFFFFSRSLYLHARLWRLSRSCQRTRRADGSLLLLHEREISPFSWMRYIIVSKSDLAENEDAILAHEKAHVKHRHSVDLLFSELFILLHWFNPAAWLMKKELQHTHEFQADETVLDSGIDAKTYQLLLIKKTVGSQRFTSVANSFNHSKLKSRITMMLKEKSNAWARLKYLYVLPLAAISVAAFAHPEISSSLEQVSAAKVSDLFVKDQAPTDSTAFPLVIIDDKVATWEEFQELQAFLQDKIYKISILKGKQATDACGEKGKNGVIFVTTMEKVASGAGDTCTPPASFIRLTSHDSTAFPLVIIDGKEVTRDEFKASSQDQFHSVTILKDNAATGTYGEKGKNGVIVISTTPPPPLSILPDSVIKKDNGFDIRLASHDSTALPLVIIDDKEVTLDELQALSEDKIHSFHILKDHAATKMYGKKGKNGVIIITTMEKASHTNTPPPPLADTILLEQTKKVEARSQKVVPVKVMKKDSSIMTVGNATKTNTK